MIVTLAFFAAVSVVTLFFAGDSPNSSTFVSERVMVLVGILLYTPIFAAENDENIHEAVVAKLVRYRRILYARYACAMAMLCITTAAYVLCNSGKIPTVLITQVNTLCISLFLGNIGTVFARLTKKAVLGYMAAFGVYAASMFSEVTYNVNILFPPVGEASVKLVILSAVVAVLGIASLCGIKNMI